MNIMNTVAGFISFVIGIIFAYILYNIYDILNSTFVDDMAIDPTFGAIVMIGFVFITFCLIFVVPLVLFISSDN